MSVEHLATIISELTDLSPELIAIELINAGYERTTFVPKEEEA